MYLDEIFQMFAEEGDNLLLPVVQRSLGDAQFFCDIFLQLVILEHIHDAACVGNHGIHLLDQCVQDDLQEH